MNEYQEALDYFAEHMILNLTYEYDEDSEEFKEFNKNYDLLKQSVEDYTRLIKHMKKTSLWDVYNYETEYLNSLIEPTRILSFENKQLKKEVNELRKKLRLVKKYEI